MNELKMAEFFYYQTALYKFTNTSPHEQNHSLGDPYLIVNIECFSL